MFKLTKLGRAIAVVAATAIAGGGLALAAAIPASATPTCLPFTSPAADVGYQSPIHGGLALDAINWGGSGHASTVCSGARVNDEIAVWKTSGAGAAADFTPVAISFPAADNSSAALACGLSGTQAVTTPSKCFELAFTPHNMTTGLCVSTVTNVDGSYARLRNCASTNQSGLATLPAGFTGTNQWQDFTTVNQGDGFFQLHAALSPAPGFDLNIKGWGSSGTPVVAYQGTGAAQNQIWEQVTAP